MAKAGAIFRDNFSSLITSSSCSPYPFNILSANAGEKKIKATHIKPHGALNNKACENYDLAKVIAESIIEVNKNSPGATCKN